MRVAPPDYAAYERRLGRVRFARRMQRQLGHVHEPGVPNNRMSPLVTTGVLEAFFRCSGLWARGRRNALAVGVTENRVRLPGLPAPLHGLRLLHLSDLHVENNLALVDVLLERLPGIPADLCLLTGDYRAETEGPWDLAMHELARLRRALPAPAFAVLGNHDCLEMLPHFEAMDLPVLLNEGRTLEIRGAPLHVAGVDDPHYYQSHDLDRALADRPHGAPCVLLSHATVLHREAEAAGVDLMLSGHTHGGQFCLPGGISLLNNTRSPRRLLRGAWRHGRLAGYTSRGVGCTGLPLRFHCPPEIVVHVLESATSRKGDGMVSHAVEGNANMFRP
jgi:predicted MPP superfamily phosphohydrolase